jgi:hypothetical protein
MRFDEPDMREAYRRGARDCFDSLVSGIAKREARKIEEWFKELDAWDYSDPPPTPLT